MQLAQLQGQMNQMLVDTQNLAVKVQDLVASVDHQARVSTLRVGLFGGDSLMLILMSTGLQSRCRGIWRFVTPCTSTPQS